MTPAVFLDRDGVLNKAVVRGGCPYPPAGLDDLELAPGVATAMAALRGAGFLLIGVTNQPDVARGTTTRAAVEAINDHLSSLLALDDMLTCFHDDADGCDCRKPLPGNIHRAAARHGIDLSRSFMVGDRWKDIAAAAAAGLSSVWIDHGYAERYAGPVPDHRCRSTPEAARYIIRTLVVDESLSGSTDEHRFAQG